MHCISVDNLIKTWRWNIRKRFTHISLIKLEDHDVEEFEFKMYFQVIKSRILKFNKAFLAKNEKAVTAPRRLPV